MMLDYMLPVLYKWNNKAWMTAYPLITAWFNQHFKPTIETCSLLLCWWAGRSGIFKIPFKILLLIDKLVTSSEL